MKHRIVFVWMNFNMHVSYGHGVGILAAVAKQQGAEVFVYHVHPDLGNPADEVKCAREIAAFQPTMVCISNSSLEWSFTKLLAKELRKTTPAMLVDGGHHATFTRSEDGFELFDYVVVGEGEKPITDFLSGKRPGDRKVVGELMKDLDALPFSDREVFEMQKIIDHRGGIVDFISQRGCPYNCSYCSNHTLLKMYGAGFLRQRSVPSIMKEIKQLLAKYRVKMIFFHDDIFTLRKDYVKEFCEVYNREVDMPWMINSHINHMGDEMIEALCKTKLIEVKIGVESGDEEVRSKTLSKKITNALIIDRFRAIHERGIRTCSFMIHGLPGTFPDSYEKGVSLIATIQPRVVRSSIFYPLPNTVLGNSYHFGDVGKTISMVGDRPASVLDKDGNALLQFYTFGWRINEHLGITEYSELVKKYSTPDKINVETMKRDDAELSAKVSPSGKLHYRYGNECSMIKLQNVPQPAYFQM